VATAGVALPGGPGEFARSLFGWWTEARVARDDLPWRRRSDPWHVLVAEVMLAQTQASRVATSYARFMEAFPSAAVCAEAPEGEVLRHWIGLGYNARALRLQSSARQIVELHQGRVPSELSPLLALPGVGPYIARAVQSFAFDIPVGVFDTNIARVLARAIAGRRLGRGAAQDLADAVVDVRAPREWNLALMDLGALCCTARVPHCDRCPLLTAQLCAWRSSNEIADPADGSAGVSRAQPRFRGSDREIRGRLVKMASADPLADGMLSSLLSPDVPAARLERVVADLVREGLLRRAMDGSLHLG
jgi:A/G-specific adenine glycosylase